MQPFAMKCRPVEGRVIVEPMGIELIKDRLGQALAGGAHPRRIKLVRFPYPTLPIIKPPKRVVLLLVEPMGIEPMSESNLEGTSPGAVCYLHSLIPARTNTLRKSVASLCMVRAKLSVRTVPTQITPEPGSWAFRGGCAPN